VSEFIVNPDTYLDTDSIGLYYSHPSIRTGWAMDSITHGRSWPNRSSSSDDENLTSGWLRRSWGTLLRDLGYQYDFVSYLDVAEGRIDLSKRFKVIILPQILCLSDQEVKQLRNFLKSGGTLIADALYGLLTETGRGRQTGALDILFGVSRDESRGYPDGKGLTEIAAERYTKPFPERLHAYDGVLRKGAMVVFERGTRAAGGAGGEPVASAQAVVRHNSDGGGAFYLNLCPTAYAYFPFSERRNRPPAA